MKHVVPATKSRPVEAQSLRGVKDFILFAVVGINPILVYLISKATNDDPNKSVDE